MITRLKIHGRSYHCGTTMISVRNRRVTLMQDGVKCSMARAEAAAMLKLWRRCEETVRRGLIRRLVELDRNGIWTDQDSRDAGYPPLTVEAAQQCILDLERDEEEGGDPSPA